MTICTQPQRYSTAGMAHAAADRLSAETGVPHRQAFAPRSPCDFQPFIVVITASEVKS